MRGRIACSFLPRCDGSKPILLDMLAYKTELLAGDKPTCLLERVAVNLADVNERRRFLGEMATRGKRGVVLTEGLLIYLSKEEVAQFAEDLSGVASLQRWILDMHSPRLLAMMQRRTGKALEKVGAPFKFGPAEGPDFFRSHGWTPVRWKVFFTPPRASERPPLLLVCGKNLRCAQLESESSLGRRLPCAKAPPFRMHGEKPHERYLA